jgi:CRISPR-associated exonuclease Cas4
MSLENEPIQISALQHWAYCPRQYALIHLEQEFEENLFTLRGQALHERVDDPGFEVREGMRIERALPLFCDHLGLIGKADVVEFLSDGTPYPVEYKHGSRDKRADIAACDDVQLAGEAVCLEEMFGCAVSEGALYYARSCRRRIVAIDASLRQKLEESLVQIREAQTLLALPPPTKDPARCRACSLKDICQPEALNNEAECRAVLARLFSTED